ncbi:MAG: 3D domain-containing protein [Phycisphaerae bacterium]|nr:3D domain-containing protein [Phycisphaerae bacterium]
MKRAESRLPWGRRGGSRRRILRRRVRRALNVVAVLLSIWWLKTDHHLATDGTALQAATATWIDLDDLPSAVREALSEIVSADERLWDEEMYVPGSNQRVVWPDEWSDPELTVVEVRVLHRAAIVDVEAPGDQAAGVPEDRPRVEQPGRRASPVERESADGARERAVEASSKSPAARAPTVRKSKAKTQGTRRVWFTVTAYCPCKQCCGRWSKYHRTASGLALTYNGGYLVAADTSVLPFHTKVRIPGYAGGRAVPVVDRGSAVKGHMLDVFFPTHWSAKQWGRKRLLVEILP